MGQEQKAEDTEKREAIPGWERKSHSDAGVALSRGRTVEGARGDAVLTERTLVDGN
jgi:hypothetical protein